jgi:hypothetical protein
MRSIWNTFGARHSLLACAFIVSLSLLFSAGLFAQNTVVSLSMADTSLEALIQEISMQTEIDFVFNHEELEKSPRISISVSGESVEAVLDQCLAGSGLSYKKVNNTIIITPEKKLSKSSRTEGPVQTVRGIVKDRESGIPLPFANAWVVNSQPLIGANTNMQGIFELKNVPVGRHSLRVTYVGYKDAVLSEVVVGSAKEVSLSIEIEEALESLGEVSVSLTKGEPLNQMAVVSSRSFNVDETKRYPATVSDPARMAQVFAGVTGNDDSTNEIIIRGNSPNWMIWRLEGVEIPSPNHFAEEGYSSGAISILSTNMIGLSDFYTGAFPAEYGAALSGVFDIKFRNGNNQQREYAFQAGLLGIEFAAEGPFKKGYDGSYLVNYRYSTFALMNRLNFEISQNALPNYQDLSYKINLPTKKAGTFSLWAIGGMGDDDEKYLPDSTLSENPENGYRDYTKTGMYALGLSHTYFPDDKSYLKTVVSHSMNGSTNHYYQMDSLGFLYTNWYDEMQNRAFRIRTLYNRKFSSRHTIRAGLNFNRLNYSYFGEQADAERALIPLLNSDGSTMLFQGYLQGKYKFTEKVLITGGLHYAYFHQSRDHSLEPRLGLQITLPKRQKLSFGFGHHSKNENLPVYYVEQMGNDGSVYMPNLDLKMIRSTHYVAGYDLIFGKDMHLKLEAYYQDINKLPVPINPEHKWIPSFGGVNPEDTLSNSGKGRNYGLELTLQKFFTEGYYFLTTASIYDSKYKPADGQWHNTRYNSNYIFNLVGGKEILWGKNKMLEFSSRLLWNGGKRLVAIDLEESEARGETVADWDKLFSSKARDYFRVDLGLRLHFYKKRVEHIISLDIQNLTNRLNVWTQYYNTETGSIEDYHMAGIIPILSFRVEF